MYFRVGRRYAYISQAVKGQLLREVGIDAADAVERLQYLCCRDVRAKWLGRVSDYLKRLAHDRPDEFEERFVRFDFRGDEARRELTFVLADFCSIAGARTAVWRLLDPRDPVSAMIATMYSEDRLAELESGGCAVELLILRVDVRSLLGRTRPLVWVPIVRSQVARVHGRLDEFIVEMRTGKAIPPDAPGRPSRALRHSLMVSRAKGVVILDPVSQAFGWRPGATLVEIPAHNYSRNRTQPDG